MENSTFFEDQEINGKTVKQFNLEYMEAEYDVIQVRMRKLVNESSKCFTALSKHSLGLRCATCDPSTYQYFIFDLLGAELKLQANYQMCIDVTEACYDYLSIMEEMNQNIVLNILSEAASQYNFTNQTNSTDFEKAQNALN